MNTNALFFVDFRKYQQDMLDIFEQQYRAGDRKYHFVAPPGSGKTIIGLEIIRRIGEKAVVFAPNQAIQGQWIRRCKEITNDLTISSDIHSDADILSLTYQIISTKEAHTEKLHKNALEILEILKNRKTIVLDECHHLTAYWADIISTLITDHVYVVGLTATPPQEDRGKSEKETYNNLLDEVDYEILLPPVVKEGYLAPFQDLVYIVEPTEEEVELIQRLCRNYTIIMTKLLDVTDFLPIHFWAEKRLADYRDREDKPVPFDELFLEHPDFCIALARFVKSKSMDIPVSVIVTEDMEAPLIFDDVLLVIEDYVAHYLSGIPKAAPYVIELKKALKEMGYLITLSGIKILSTGIRSILGFSQSKMLSMKRIIRHEMRHMQDDFRALILTDYELTDSKDGTSAFEVMNLLTSDPETDPCDPIMLTGKSVLVDDDLLPEFLVCAESYFERENLSITLEYEQIKGFFKISSPSPAWTTKVYVNLITYILERGISRCLVSTKSLLGEGWDSIKLNTLIDLTLVTSFAFTNQIQGRTIRLDPDNPHKSANNWDILAVLGNSEHGYYDYQRLLKKYDRFFGISDDGIIEKGIGHVHPYFTGYDMDFLVAHKDEVNQIMFDRGKNRLDLFHKWNIKGPYKNQIIHSVEIIRGDETSTELPMIPETTAVKLFMYYHTKILKASKNIFRTGTSIMIFASIAFPFFIHTLFPVIFNPVFIVILVFLILGLKKASRTLNIRYYDGKVKKALTRKQDFINSINDICMVILYTLRKCDLCEKHITKNDVVITERKDGSIRCFLKNSSYSSHFAIALSDILSPIQGQKYFLVSENYTPDDTLSVWDICHDKKGNLGMKEIRKLLKKQNQQPDTGMIPVPDLFSKNKDDAKIFCTYWNRNISGNELVGKRSKLGKELVQKNFRTRTFNVMYRKKEIWM